MNHATLALLDCSNYLVNNKACTLHYLQISAKTTVLCVLLGILSFCDFTSSSHPKQLLSSSTAWSFATSVQRVRLTPLQCYRISADQNCLMASKLLAACLAGIVTQAAALNFTISNGQIFTPGFAILDAPQPGTPLGGGKSWMQSRSANWDIVLQLFRYYRGSTGRLCEWQTQSSPI